MKSKKILSILLILCFAFGTGVGLSSKNASNICETHATDSKRYIYFYNGDAKYSNPYIYTWSSETVGSWPGKALSRVGSSNFYFTDISTGATKCKFSNNGSSETSEQTIPDKIFSCFFTSAGDWSWKDATVSSAYISKSNNWSETAMTIDSSCADLKYTASATFNYVEEESAYVADEFKIIHKIVCNEQSGTAYYDFGAFGWGSGTARTEAQIIDGKGDDHNLKVTTPGTYQITFYPLGGAGGDGVGAVQIPSITTKDISVSANTGGTANKTPDITTFGYGSTVTITATPNQTYQFSKWSDNNTSNPRNIVVGSSTLNSYAAFFLEIPSQTIISFNANTGTGGPSNTVTATNGLSMPTISDKPVKPNSTFLGYFDSATGGNKYYNADLSSAQNWNKTDETSTLYAHWQINSGTYMAFSSEGMVRDGAHAMTLNGSSGTQYKILNHQFATDGLYMKTYYVDSSGNVSWEEATNVKATYTHPSYPAHINNSTLDCVIEKSGYYDIYYNTTTKEYHIHNRATLDAGRYFVTYDSSGSNPTYTRATEATGYTGKEFTATITLTAGQYLRAYYQDSSQTTIYDCTLQKQSVKEWVFEEGKGFKCPAAGTYSFYLISDEDPKVNFDIVSIYLQGEIEADVYAKDFNDTLCAICETTKHSGYASTLGDAWSTMSTKWTTLKTNYPTSAALFTTDASVSSTIGECIAKYRYILYKYNPSHSAINDFMGIFTNADTGKLYIKYSDFTYTSLDGVEIQEQDNVTLIIVLSSVSLLAVAGASFFIYKKKKHN